MNRWSILVALIADPAAESSRLIALLSRWPAESRRHRILDDKRA